MALKKKVYLSAETQELCAVLTKGDETNWSGSINTLASRYNVIIEELLPELHEGEKLALCKIYNGHALSDDIRRELASFTHAVADSLDCEPDITGILKSYDIDVETFKKRCFGFSLLECMAIIDMTQRFWNHDVTKEVDDA